MMPFAEIPRGRHRDEDFFAPGIHYSRGGYAPRSRRADAGRLSPLPNAAVNPRMPPLWTARLPIGSCAARRGCIRAEAYPNRARLESLRLAARGEPHASDIAH